MGNVAGYRKAWIDAADYVRRWDKWEAGAKAGDPPKRDLQLETLAGVLRGDILVQNHCYRADEMAVMVDVAREFRFKIRTFHHANERSEEGREGKEGGSTGRYRCWRYQ